MSSGVKQTKRAKRRDPVYFSDAEQALRMGSEQGAAVAVNALAETLNLVANLLDPKNGKKSKLSVVRVFGTSERLI